MQPKVLLVDDDPRATEALQRVLSQECYQIIVAHSAEEALVILSQKSVNVIISDERMPGLSGSEFLASVRHNHPDIARIILTGHASLKATLHAINKSEVHHFLTKPCSRQDLTDAIAHGLERQEHQKTASGAVAGTQCASAPLRDLEKDVSGITWIKREPNGIIVLEEEETDLGTVVQALNLISAK